ncbi:hypothetical protein MANES_11G097150v8 [Manihot esculenta]|uniref:Uncharacterized protein n=1 Tax=Manihot esculenta TaxID=3983 RepID=A0ACB7GUP0_MANES|nr:hypothetical protein MANES_11G097150v8 [Manihot esculenta]
MESQNDQMLQSTSDSNQTNTDASTETTTSSKAKRKSVKPRSAVWDHFTKFVSDEGELKGKCNYCKKEFCCDPKRNGTTALRNHLNSCKKHPHSIETRQAQLSLQKKCKKALVHMIIIDELPFRFVEGEKNCQRVSLTTDTWTSLQRINYMCITAHFIDNDWNHKGEAVGRAIETCLLEWGSNDVAICYLKKKLANWGDGLKDVNDSVMKVRDARFKECVLHEKIESKSSLCLDVPTRWNSTYLMLNTAQKYERAFERYESQDPMFKIDMGENDIPDYYDWTQLTLRISGSSDLAFILNQWINSNDFDMKSMGERMKFMVYSFSQMYGKEKVYQPNVEQFNDNSSQQLSGSCSTTDSINPKPKFFLKHHYKKQKLEESGGFDSKTELEVYLSEAIQEEKEDFDVMKWWKINSERFPILGKMARDILVIPISTVASESAFSTGGRVLDSFRSSLTPKIVEGLICVQDWIRPLNIQVNVEEDLDELEKLEEGMLYTLSYLY